MKKIMVVLALAAVAYVGYAKWSEWKSNNSPAPDTSQTSAPTPAPHTEVAATPAPRNLLPEGTYILLARVDVTTDAGITAVPAGTKVKFVSATQDGMMVTDGSNQFHVSSSQVTNDLDEVSRITGVAPSGLAAAPSTQIVPNGTYFLLQNISVTTDAGITGIPPGTKVTFVKATDNGMLVSDGTNQFEVTASQVTSDFTVAQQAFKADASAQARLSAFQQQQNALSQKPTALATPAPTAPPFGQTAPPPAASAPGDSLSGGAYGNTKDKKYKENGHQYWIDAQGRRHYDY